MKVVKNLEGGDHVVIRENLGGVSRRTQSRKGSK